ncbi:MAG TPA: hypothetical protein VM536_12060 [Chloroflexia bacterium]|nr:hypothetical protein [Chloroflexia bacterium]
MTIHAPGLPAQEESAPPSCPRCGTADGVQSVARLVAATLATTPTPGHAPLRWQGTTYYLPLGRNLPPAVSRAVRLFPPERLRRPPEPELVAPRGVPREVLIGGAVVVLVIAIGGYLLVGPPWIVLMLLGLLTGARVASRAMVAGNYLDSLGSNGMATTAVQQNARITAALEAYDPTKPRHREAMKKAEAKQARATARWQSAYYCPQDDVVFVPGDRGTVRPEQMDSLLYS